MPQVKVPFAPKGPDQTRVVFHLLTGSIMRGTGDNDYLCGYCGALLAKGMAPTQIADILLQCPNCGQNCDFRLLRIRPVYTLIARNRMSTVKPGGKLEIEFFLSGYGVPEKNKLHIQWSSPHVIDAEKPGLLRQYICGVIPDTPGKSVGVVPIDLALDPIGATSRLDNRVYFSEVPTKVPECGLKNVNAEGVWGDKDEQAVPLLLTVNTSKKAPSGDYQITCTFTYGSEQHLLQDYRAVDFHVAGWWERNQAWVYIAGTILAFTTLAATAVGTFFQAP